MGIMRWVQIVVGVLVVGIAALVFFSGRAANLSCDEIASEAKRISQDQPSPIRNITDIRETSRTVGRGTGEGRCEGRAELGDGTKVPIYMRAFETGSNLMVEYSPTPFADAPPAQ